ncbi:hypothetical protein C8046_17695 [Serinibacter arcticus]|uniref:Integral membrane protein n=1 Tax=Serinibacter arcticus TaxID=1655435 RepID=A0A2U1ZZ26_9MICO|nr:hypothetical protein [Serinibacter arcticus]PWD52200.1 hypothetical protein C8046_17695 [Serinibacter arcticus]
MTDVPTLTLTQCERFFRRHGLPLLVDGHSLRRDVFGRSAPFLLVFLLFGTVGVLNTTWSWQQNVAASAGALVAVAGLYALLNLVRGRPWNQLPQDVGRPELAFFVLAPAVTSWLLGGNDWVTGLVTIVVNLLVLAIVRFVVGLGLLSTLGWGVMRVATELGQSLRRLVRLLPLIVIFSIVLFFTTEVWQVFDRISDQADFALAGFFVLIIVALATSGSRREADAVLEGVHASRPGDDPAATFTPRQRTNVVAMIATTQLLQILVVSLATFAFFVMVGVLAITPEVRGLWDVGGGSFSEPLGFGDVDLVLDQTLLRVAGALATFSGLYYGINVQVDAVYRTEFVEDVGRQLHQVVDVRERYLALLETGGRDGRNPPRTAPDVP